MPGTAREELLVDRIEAGEVAEVGEIGIHLQHVRELRAGGAQACRHVLERPAGLLFDPTRHELSLLVERDLPRRVDEAAVGHDRASTAPSAAPLPPADRALAHEFPSLERAQRLMPASTRVAVDLGELVVGEVEVVERGEVLLELLDAARADQRRGHARVAQRPGERQLGERLAAPLRRSRSSARTLRERLLGEHGRGESDAALRPRASPSGMPSR